MNLAHRVSRHARLTWQNYAPGNPSTPPFLILFINSICNLTCEHCFYWRMLNRKDDLTQEEIFRLADELGTVENLNLSGGEPFIRPDFAEIVRYFITHNGTKQVYVPTNGYFTDRTIKALESVLQEKSLELFACELSIDGMPEYHNRFRGSSKSFQKLMETYEALAELQKRNPRLRIHSISTATNENLEEIKRLTTYLYDRCPAMDHHNLAVIRGDRMNPDLLTPDVPQYRELYDYIRRLWAPREEQRFGAIVEPMLQWAKCKTLEAKAQFVPCRAGVLSAVIYANGDVSMCELHKSIGNLREKSFREIWTSQEARELRQSISDKKCWCTTEVFLWSSINYQPVHLAKAMLGAQVWKKVPPLPASEKLVVIPDAPPAGAALRILQPAVKDH